MQQAGMNEPPRPSALWFQRAWVWVIATALLIGLFAPLAAIGWYQYEHVGRVFRGVSALGVDLGGMSSQEADRALAARAGELIARPTLIRAGDQQWRTDWGRLGLRLPTAPIIDRAVAVGREGNPLRRLRAQTEALGDGYRVGAEEFFDESILTQFVQGVAGQIDRPVRNARLELLPDLTFDFTSAQSGRKVDIDESLRRLREAADVGAEVVDLPVVVTEPLTTDDMRLPAKERAERIIASPIGLEFRDRRWTLGRQDLADLLVFSGGPGIPIDVRLDSEALMPRIKAIAAEVAQKPQDARLDWNRGNPRPIRPSLEGRELDAVEAARLIAQRADGAERTIPLPVKVIRPAVDAEMIGQMGIREPIESATTSFVGALPQKQHNIKLAVSRLNGLVVPPRSLFSFNRALGPTALDNGYQIALGITSDGSQARTVPSVAGGICQVATTLFQPVFWAGYQIEERHWHLYWIPAYTSRGLVGLDVTVDEDSDLDFRFQNNSDTYLLFQARADDSSVTFDLYGTKPDWQVKVDGPTLTDTRPADPTPVIEPVPALPDGERILAESAREGFAASILRTVIENGNQRQLRLQSRYVPSRNVTLVGTGGRPVAAPGSESQLNRPAPGSTGSK